MLLFKLEDLLDQVGYVCTGSYFDCADGSIYIFSLHIPGRTVMQGCEREHKKRHISNVVHAGVRQSEETFREKYQTQQSTESTSHSSSSVFIVSNRRSRPPGHSTNTEHGSCGQRWENLKNTTGAWNLPAAYCCRVCSWCCCLSLAGLL